MRKRKYWLYVLLAFAAAGTLMELLIAYGLSPLYHGVFDFDQPIFWEIGKGWAQGRLPYRDLTDLKGPYIFLVNAVGYLVFRNFHGMMVMDVISFTAAGFFVTKTMNLFMSEKKALISAVALQTLFAVPFWASGDTVSGYLLPFMSCSWWLIARWIRSDTADCPPKWAFVFGITFGLCAMSRMLDGIAVAVPCLYISVMLAAKKRWKNLAECAVSCAAGAAVICVSFIAYFALHGALSEMMYGTFGMGASYFAGTFKTDMLTNIMTGAILIVPALGLLAVAAEEEWSQPKSYIVLFTCAICEAVLFCRLPISRYYISYVPTACLASVMAFQSIRKANGMKAAACVSIVLAVMFAVPAGKISYRTYASKRRDSAHDDAYVAKAMSMIPAAEKSSIAFWGTYPKYYITYNVQPKMRYFAGQPWNIVSISGIEKEFRKDFEKNATKWLVVNASGTKFEEKYIRERYKEVWKKKNISLLKLKAETQKK